MFLVWSKTRNTDFSYIFILNIRKFIISKIYILYNVTIFLMLFNCDTSTRFVFCVWNFLFLKIKVLSLFYDNFFANWRVWLWKCTLQKLEVILLIIVFIIWCIRKIFKIHCRVVTMRKKHARDILRLYLDVFYEDAMKQLFPLKP